MPRLRSFSISEKRRSLSRTERAEAGSSMISTLASSERAFAISTSCPAGDAQAARLRLRRDIGLELTQPVPRGLQEPAGVDPAPGGGLLSQGDVFRCTEVGDQVELLVDDGDPHAARCLRMEGLHPRPADPHGPLVGRRRAGKNLH